MTRCPITYQLLSKEELEIGYSKKGLALLSPSLKFLNPLPYTSEQLRTEGMQRSAKMSIQGIQAKVSAIIKPSGGQIELVNTRGRYIIKPQSAHYNQLPENEDLTMKMAAVINIKVPPHGLIKSKDGSLSYIVKRFDRISQNSKLAVEDFAQLANKNRETKYNSSIEQVVSLIEKFSSFPIVEYQKLLRLLLFCFVTGNEDMHLKNFSLIRDQAKIELSPAYDLLNTTLAINTASEESALPIRGKKKGLTKALYINYLAQERMKLPEKVALKELSQILSAKQLWKELIEISFLSSNAKESYLNLLEERLGILLKNFSD